MIYHYKRSMHMTLYNDVIATGNVDLTSVNNTIINSSAASQSITGNTISLGNVSGTDADLNITATQDIITENITLTNANLNIDAGTNDLSLQTINANSVTTNSNNVSLNADMTADNQISLNANTIILNDDIALSGSTIASGNIFC